MKGRSVLDHMRAICLALPDTKETLTWGQPHFRVGEKIFAGCGEEKGRVVDRVQARQGPRGRDVVKDPRFWRAPYCRPQGLGLDGRRRRGDWDELRPLVLESYELIAPRRTVARLDGGAPPAAKEDRRRRPRRKPRGRPRGRPRRARAGAGHEDPQGKLGDPGRRRARRPASTASSAPPPSAPASKASRCSASATASSGSCRATSTTSRRSTSTTSAASTSAAARTSASRAPTRPADPAAPREHGDLAAAAQRLAAHHHRRRRHRLLGHEARGARRAAASASSTCPRRSTTTSICRRHVDTFGFQTARHLGVEIVKNLMVDAKTTSRWYFVIAMGRKAGHLALGIGKAAGATLTLIPEEFADERIRLKTIVDTLVGAIIKRLSHGPPRRRGGDRRGARARASIPRDLAQVDEVERDAHGNLRIAEVNIGEILKARSQARLARSASRRRSSAKNIGYELRCADPIPFDMEYTRDLGYCAAKYLLAGGNAVDDLHAGGQLRADPVRAAARPGDRPHARAHGRHPLDALRHRPALHDPPAPRRLRRRRTSWPSSRPPRASRSRSSARSSSTWSRTSRRGWW